MLKRLFAFLRGWISYFKTRALLSLYLKHHTLDELEILVQTKITPKFTAHHNKHIYIFPKGGVATFDFTARTFTLEPTRHAR